MEAGPHWLKALLAEQLPRLHIPPMAFCKYLRSLIRDNGAAIRIARGSRLDDGQLCRTLPYLLPGVRAFLRQLSADGADFRRVSVVDRQRPCSRFCLSLSCLRLRGFIPSLEGMLEAPLHRICQCPDVQNNLSLFPHVLPARELEAHVRLVLALGIQDDFHRPVSVVLVCAGEECGHVNVRVNSSNGIRFDSRVSHLQVADVSRASNLRREVD